MCKFVRMLGIKHLNKYNHFIPRIDAKETHFNVSLGELYPNISSLDENDREYGMRSF